MIDLRYTRRHGASLVLGALLSSMFLLLPLPAGAQADIPLGLADFRFVDERGNPDRPIHVWTYRPAQFDADSPIVFVMHGTLRNAETYRRPWIPLADRDGCLVVCPEFSREHYGSSYSYHFGNVVTPRGEPIDEAKWTFTAIENLFDHVRKSTGSRMERYWIFGHSAGAQFVHRMVLMKPDSRIAVAVAANAGSYTMPVHDARFPYGLGGLEYENDRLRRALHVPLVVMLGERDNDPECQHLPRGRAAMAQGPHRLARGRRFMELATTETAEESPADVSWRLHVVPAVGHDNRRIAPHAARVMFPPSRSAADQP